ncbi:MAG: pyruvate kinase, partial [Myxococcales bacterium]|nr:pyruvate kinase [Myxococcales bacterium]
AAPPGVAAIGCTLDAAVRAIQPGHRVLFDDGHLEAVAEATDDAGATLRVRRLAGADFALRAEKGINLPDTRLDVPALGPDDERALAFAVDHADVVEASFVRSPDDVRALHARLDALGGRHLGVVLKIETGDAFAQLPAILLEAMTRPPVGVMIARGDLAVEIGFERLAEVQEEILWLCEAAHLPVIWATQVLDTLARTGQPSRAEVTDAAMSGRAECVMLNKGPFVAEAVAALDDILRRMAAHQHKKRSLFRRLAVAQPVA